ncbi:hypothetical protein K438DRAFT_1852804, partial [Mycena galopus ATCC 62051]
MQRYRRVPILFLDCGIWFMRRADAFCAPARSRTPAVGRGTESAPSHHSLRSLSEHRRCLLLQEQPFLGRPDSV